MKKTYSELITLPTIEERYRYLRTNSGVGIATFGGNRYLNQLFYMSDEWRRFRNEIIIRDGGFDLAVEGYPVVYRPTIHHINPISQEEVLSRADSLMDPENVVLCSYTTHKAIHYGTEEMIDKGPVIRTPNDTCPWK